MTAPVHPARFGQPERDPVDVIAIAIARALARQHHAETLAISGEGKTDERHDPPNLHRL